MKIKSGALNFRGGANKNTHDFCITHSLSNQNRMKIKSGALIFRDLSPQIGFRGSFWGKNNFFENEAKHLRNSCWKILKNIKIGLNRVAVWAFGTIPITRCIVFQAWFAHYRQILPGPQIWRAMMVKRFSKKICV